METVALSVDHRRSHGLATRLFGPVRRDAQPAGPGHVVRRVSPTIIKSAGDRTFAVIASTGSVDRQGDIVEAGGWILGPYRRNPVVCWAHDYRSLPVGRAQNVRVEGNALKAEIVFPSEGTSQFADRCVSLIQSGVLRGISVGFRPAEWSFLPEGRGIHFLKHELLEISVVPVPANGDALIELPLATERSYPARPRLAARVVELERLRA